jgi:FkbM family methyltransferase
MHNSLMALPLSSRVRDLYLRTFKHEFWRKYVLGLRQFYEEFVSSGSLVFDIGANEGEHSRCFLSLGARVVAVEPLPGSVKIIRSTARPKNRIHVVEAAAGADFSEAVLHVSSESQLCTLSDRWLSVAENPDGPSGNLWDKEIKVRVIPIHSLVSKYGPPDFIKIDVEGFESQVLSGLKELPPALSFEFDPKCSPDVTIECLNSSCFSSTTMFAYHIGVPYKNCLSSWMKRDSMVSEIQHVYHQLVSGDDDVSRNTPTFGDIVALRS